jgi:hypothetical protein
MNTMAYEHRAILENLRWHDQHHRCTLYDWCHDNLGPDGWIMTAQFDKNCRMIPVVYTKTLDQHTLVMLTWGSS